MNRTSTLRVLFVIALMVVAFLAGRWTQKPIESIEYIVGETVRDTIEKPVPYYIDSPANPILPTKPDTIYLPGKEIIVVQRVDTAQIIADYIKRNFYRETVFKNDTTGTMTIDAVVQYNKMQLLGYTFTPVIKKVTVERKRTITPFISSSVNSFRIIGVGGGIYYKNVGVEMKHVTDFKNKGLEIGVHLKF